MGSIRRVGRQSADQRLVLYYLKAVAGSNRTTDSSVNKTPEGNRAHLIIRVHSRTTARVNSSFLKETAWQAKAARPFVEKTKVATVAFDCNAPGVPSSSAPFFLCALFSIARVGLFAQPLKRRPSPF